MKAKKIILIDNYDSFTYNLYDYFLQLGVDCHVFRNDEISAEKILAKKYDGIVFSPGPGRPNESGNMMQILEVCFDKLPILGICLGHQAIGEFFGAKLISGKPMFGKVDFCYFENHPAFNNFENPLQIMRYHALCLDKLENTSLKIIGKTKQNEIMAIVHKSLPIWGFQFHPESILTLNGLQLLKNWLNSF